MSRYKEIKNEMNQIRIRHEQEWLNDPVNLYGPDEEIFRSTDMYRSKQEFTERFPGVRLYSAGGLVPFEVEGLIMGYPFYMRSRGGYSQGLGQGCPRF